MEKTKILVIAGPTAVGKSSYALNLASRFEKYFSSSHIINADAMAVYKGMEIMSASPLKKDKQLIAHHLYNYVENNEEYNVQRYRTDLDSCIKTILDKSSNPLIIIVGGSCQYISSVIENIQYPEFQNDPIVRKKHEELYDINPKAYFDETISLDPELASFIKLNDKKRLVRAREVMEITGEKMSYWKAISKSKPSLYDFFGVYAVEDRDVLRLRIQERVEMMLLQGLVNEVKSVLEQDKKPSKTASCTIGFPEISSYLRGEISLDFAKEKIFIRSCQLAKRQRTWFKNKEYLKPYHLIDDRESLEKDIVNYYKLR